MKFALRIFLTCMITLAFLVAAAFAGTDETMKLLQGRNFWTGYKWGKPVSDSKLFKTTKWRLRRTDADDLNYYYDTDMTIADKPTQLTISISKKSKTVSGYQATFEEIPFAGYTELLRWAEGVYGKPDVYYEFKTKAGDGIFTSYIIRRSSWIMGDSLVTLALTADMSLKPLVVDLAIADKNKTKPDRPSTRLICKNMSMKSSPDQQVQTKKMNDITLVLDENSFQVFDGNLDPAGMTFTHSANSFKVERKSDIGSLVYFINRVSGRLEGTSTSYGEPSIVSGDCEYSR